MEEVQKYECLYNKFSKDYKNKFTRLNCWRKIGEKFDVDAAEAEKKYKNIRTAYGRYLKKKKSVPSGSGRDAVPPQEFTNLDWLANHINHKASTVTNMPRRESEDEDEEEERQLQNNSQHVAEVDDEESLNEHEDPLTPLHDESPTCSPNAAANENQPKTTKQKEETKTKSTTKRAWASNLKKTKDQDIDFSATHAMSGMSPGMSPGMSSGMFLLTRSILWISQCEMKMIETAESRQSPSTSMLPSTVQLLRLSSSTGTVSWL